MVLWRGFFFCKFYSVGSSCTAVEFESLDAQKSEFHCFYLIASNSMQAVPKTPERRWKNAVPAGYNKGHAKSCDENSKKPIKAFKGSNEMHIL